MAGEAAKLPLRRLELPIHKFIKVAIPTDLERLHKHQVNIKRCQRFKQWDRLHQEHINASRTVQALLKFKLFKLYNNLKWHKQLRANMREMEKLCGHVRSEDARALEKLVRPIREQAVAAIWDFLQLHSEAPAPPGPLQTAPQGPTMDPPAPLPSFAAPDNLSGDREGEELLFAQTQVALPEIPVDQSAAESWEILEEDLRDLNTLVNEFSEMVHSQQAKIDGIEDNVEAAAANVEAGSRSLGKAAKYKMAVLPMAGAVLGGVVGGPLGLLAGFKVAGVVAAVSGGLLGYVGGNAIQKTRRANVDLQLQQLSSSSPATPHQGGCKGE